MNRRARISNAVATSLIRLAVALVVLVLVWSVAHIVMLGWGRLTSAAFLSGSPDPAGGGGVGPQLFNTLYILVLSSLITVPVGLAAGIHFAEYAGDGPITGLIRRATETLATLPSIVVGLFGYALCIHLTHSHPNRLAASLALVVINLPYAARISEEALRSLPPSLREGGLALGATRWQTIRRVLLPGALPALISGWVLLAGRCFGEAAAVLFPGSAGAVTYDPHLTLSPFAPGDTLAVNLYSARILNDSSNVAAAGAYADGMAALLIVVVLVFNVSARLVGRIALRKLQGAQ